MNSNSEMDFAHNNNEQQNDFEGPEKNLQVIFSNSSSSLLQISQNCWEKMLDGIHCSIISRKSNQKCISFILSESSLFVFKDRVILKTCGTIPLLLSIDEIIKIGHSNGLKVAAVLYWRKNFIHPEKQLSPHNSFFSEVKFLDSRFGKFNSSKIRCGPFSHDHWYFYYVELENKNNFRPIFPTYELKMHEINPCVSDNFVIENCYKENITVQKVRNIIPKASIDEFFFDPCGYSMNALFGNTEEYETIHITPEHRCSYVSFESFNYELLKDTKGWTNKILRLFHPFSVIGVEVSSRPKNISSKQFDGYVEAYPISSYNLNGIYITFWSYILKEKESHPLAPIAEKRKNNLSRVLVLDEVGKYSGLEPPPNSKYLLARIDNPVIVI